LEAALRKDRGAAVALSHTREPTPSFAIEIRALRPHRL